MRGGATPSSVGTNLNGANPPVGSSSTALIDPSEQGDDRVILNGLLTSLPLSLTSRLPANVQIGIVVVDSNLNVVRTLTNRRALGLLQVAPDASNIITRTDTGERFAASRSDDDVPASNSRFPETVVVPPETTNTGPYRHVYPSGVNSYDLMDQNVVLPCPTSGIPSTDTPYVYLGGDGPNGSSGGFPFESGLQYGVTYQSYAPYMRVAKVGGGTKTNYFFFTNLATDYGTQNVIGSSDPYRFISGKDGTDTNRFYCNGNTNIPFGLTYTVGKYTDTKGNVGTHFVGTALDGIGGTILLSMIVSNKIAGVQANEGSGPDYPFGGFATPCTGCVLIRTTSIAQQSTTYDGATFGPVSWENGYVQSGNNAPVASPALACAENPTWDGKITDCGNTPANTPNKAVLVTGAMPKITSFWETESIKMSH